MMLASFPIFLPKINCSIFFKGLSWQAVDSPDKFGLSPLMVAGM